MKYTKPEFEVELFELEDVLTTSGVRIGNDFTGDEAGWY